MVVTLRPRSVPMGKMWVQEDSPSTSILQAPHGLMPHQIWNL